MENGKWKMFASDGHYLLMLRKLILKIVKVLLIYDIDYQFSAQPDEIAGT